MSKSDKKIIILTEDELRKTFSRLTFEIIEKISNLENLLLVGIPTRGVHLAEVLRKEMLDKTGVDVKKGIIDPTFYRDDQNRVGTRLIEATDFPTSIEKKDIVLIDDVIYTGRTLRASIEAVVHTGRPKLISLLCLIDRGHRELPISPKFIGKNIPTNEEEYVSVFLKELDDVDKVEVK